MSKIRVQSLVTGITNYIPVEGKISFRPWFGTNNEVLIEGSGVIFPEKYEVTLTPPAPDVIDIRPSTADWCWEVEVSIPKSRAYKVYLEVPNSADILDFEDLPVVDRRTFNPIVVPPSTQQLLQEANDILESIKERTLTATVDPGDHEALILTFPSFMLNPQDDLQLILPIGG